MTLRTNQYDSKNRMFHVLLAFQGYDVGTWEVARNERQLTNLVTYCELFHILSEFYSPANCHWIFTNVLSVFVRCLVIEFVHDTTI